MEMKQSHKFMVSSFESIEQVIHLIGTTDEELLKESTISSLEMGFRVGHAIKFLKILDRFVDDVDS